jgi:hypothetical protein
MKQFKTKSLEELKAILELKQKAAKDNEIIKKDNGKDNKVKPNKKG